MSNSLKDINPQLGILLLITLFTSCKEEKGIPFPENASGFKVPVTKPSPCRKENHLCGNRGDIIVETKTGEGSEFCIEIPDNRYRR
jgi:hypothetical protein